jgi:hypothetical protein
MKAIDVFESPFVVFGIFFLFSLIKALQARLPQTYVAYSPFLIGLLLKFEFLAASFGPWNLYLINASYIKVSDSF